MKVDLVANSNSLKRRLLNCGGEKTLLVEEQMMAVAPAVGETPRTKTPSSKESRELP